MEIAADVRAFDTLSGHARAADLAAVALATLTQIARSRRVDGQAESVAKLAAERGLGPDEPRSGLADALDVLARGPKDDSEQALARALAALAAAAHSTDSTSGGLAADAEGLLWLAACTPFDATALLDRALGERAARTWTEIAEVVRRFDRGGAPAPGRGEALVAAAALASSRSLAARDEVASLRASVQDAAVVRALGATQDTAAPVAGRMTAAPRHAATTAVLAIFGVLLLARLARLVGDLALAYRRPAQVELTADGDLRIKWRVELLGRTLRDHDVVVPRTALVRAAREVRYQGIAFYAGILSLALGSYVGVATFVDGVRAASPSMLVVGIAIVALGVGLDFALSIAVPSARGRCRLVFVPRTGAKLCVGEVDIAAADAILARLARASP
ncbi:MAG TPA: hypothetical protein VKU41_00715 [Polyangiaceae bacterium]|nr:hypothetical protein [Polyangiaceae bacterium]